MSVRAKFVCTGKTLQDWEQDYFGEKVRAASLTFTPVWEGFEDNDYTKGPACAENHVFGMASPSGHLTMYIVNPRAHEQFEVNRAYYLDFNPAPTKTYDAETASYVLKD